MYDQGSRNSLSGIKATVFGGTSPLGAIVGSSLTQMGSTCIYPYRDTATFYENKFRELRVTADLGYKAALKLTDFTDLREVNLTMEESNIVVSTIGSKIYMQREDQFEESDIRVPMTIARAARDNPKVKRLIMIGAAGADPNSHSRRLRTKWLGEQEVKQIYPEVTFLRPTTMVQSLDPNV